MANDLNYNSLLTHTMNRWNHHDIGGFRK